MKIIGSRTLKKIFPFGRTGIILMYHRVADPHYDPLRLNVRPEHFQEHMTVIKKYARPAKMSDLADYSDHFSFGKPHIAVTLDDGYVDNFHNAKIICEKAGVPATFYIISGAVDNQEEFFWDGLKSTILAPDIIPPMIDISIAGQKYHWGIIPSGPCQSADYSHSISGMPSFDTALSRFQLYSVILRIMGPLSSEQKREALVQLAHWSGQNLTVRKSYLPMSLDDLRSLGRNPLFEIGAHTVNHPQLANLPVKKQEEEIYNSKVNLENLLDRPVASFSYPHGSYNEETVKLVEHLKFKNACTVVPKQVFRKVNPYLLPRFSVQDWNGNEFERNLISWLSNFEE